MALTPSTMLELGTKAPGFRLPDTEGKTVVARRLPGRPALLVIFLCNHCPYVKHVRHELARLGRSTRARGWPLSASAPTTSRATPTTAPR